MSASAAVQQADRNYSARSFPSPSGNFLLTALSRTSPNPMDRWLLMVMSAKTMKMRAVFDFLDAFGIERVQWLDDNRFILLSQCQNLSGPPGRLYEFNLVRERAVLLDDFVWRFEIAENGDDIIYERSDDPTEPYGLRKLHHLKMSNRDRKFVYQVRHPAVQFGKLGPFEAGGSFIKFEINTYGDDSFEPKKEIYWFDLMAGRSFPDSKDASPKSLEKTIETTDSK